MDQLNQNQTYLSLLRDSLSKKIDILDQLLELTLVQENLIQAGTIEDDKFEHTLTEKEKQIQMIVQLDDGFELIYQRVRDILSQGTNDYKDQIKVMQELITAITDKSVKLQAIEKRNKTKMDNLMMKKRGEIKNFKISSQTASSYYKNMAHQHQGQAYFLDKKN